MDSFNRNAIETLETLVKALNGNGGYKRKWRHDTHSYHKNTTAVLNRNKFITTRRKVLPCNR